MYDVVDGWLRVLGNPSVRGGVFNLGSGRSLSINQVAEAVIAAFGHARAAYKVVRAPARPGEQRTVRADVRKAALVLGWEPRTSFEDGLTRTIRWARDEFAAEKLPDAAARKGAQ